MKKDIKFPPVEGVFVVVAKQANETGNTIWNVYLINRNKYALENVLITSKGYGEVNNEKQETSTLRHHIPILDKNEHAIIELIDQGVFHLTNQYWVSYYAQGQLFDKKYIFLPETIIEENLIQITEFKSPVIMHS